MWGFLLKVLHTHTPKLVLIFILAIRPRMAKLLNVLQAFLLYIMNTI